MAGITDFLKALPEMKWDSVVNVMHDLQDSTSQERIESLRRFLQDLNREIDQINRKRDALGQKVANIDQLIPTIENAVRVNPSLELELFKNVLLGWKAALKAEISELRPNGKLEKKYDTERKRDLLIQLQSLVGQLSQHMTVVRPSARDVHTEPPDANGNVRDKEPAKEVVK